MLHELVQEDMFATLPPENLLISYYGDFNMPILDKLIASIKNSLQQLQVDKKNTKSIYSICVECLENIMKHGKPVPENFPVKGRFSFGVKDNKVYFIVGNHISLEDKNKLHNKLQNIDELSLDEIKNIYKHDLIHGSISDRGGAGLGMYVMAMKSNKDYKYQFLPVENVNAYYYSLLVHIDFDIEQIKE